MFLSTATHSGMILAFQQPKRAVDRSQHDPHSIQMGYGTRRMAQAAGVSRQLDRADEGCSFDIVLARGPQRSQLFSYDRRRQLRVSAPKGRNELARSRSSRFLGSFGGLERMSITARDRANAPTNFLVRFIWQVRQ